ncbi:MAG: pentapeptide repeat-containing protein, partial [Oscillospiraceae bacterium]|nr:pentapeptide repeat-containing protein [Oscillospiraceae bacterium]
KKWLETGGKEGCFAMLCYADLSGANLSSSDLRRANLSDANLSGSDLSHANLSSANLRGANLRSANLLSANLSSADLSSTDLNGANLRDADLSGADFDLSAFPLWCGGLDVNIDDYQATQLLYHLIRNVRYSKNTSEGLKAILNDEKLLKQANKFHKVTECGKISFSEANLRGTSVLVEQHIEKLLSIAYERNDSELETVVHELKSTIAMTSEEE